MSMSKGKELTDCNILCIVSSNAHAHRISGSLTSNANILISVSGRTALVALVRRQHSSSTCPGFDPPTYLWVRSGEGLREEREMEDRP
ncbi:hypothetical protein EVAR_82056_1 [Eumeta japonica]|uniref:Uncharacterized protein n=1 Tax=Eumeta variegata TaxID=151549 RepID=A0A4C1U1F0_EUMVA|nr:hypothetical protein EVAR_82056_1 [Eumeta japonica]